MKDREPRSRPPWWPADEPWPPQRWGAGPWNRGGWDADGWGRHRGRRGGSFFWRIGCAVLVLLLLAAGLMALSLWALATLLGLASAPAAVVLGGLLATVLVLLGVGAVGRALRRLSAPLDELIDAADRVTAGDYSARASERGPREVRSLTRAFNQMSARLETTDERRRSFLADVSHELRTPLTVIVGQLEAVRDGVYPPDAEHLAPVLDQARLMQRLVEDLRTLALADTGSLPLRREPLDVGALAEETAAGFRALAAAAGVVISASVEPDLPLISGDPARLRGVLDNLLANALQHTPAGGAILVSVRGDGARGGVSLEVRDNGTGISAELLPHVFERFARGSDSIGSGLGLAIAKDVVSAHGGDIDIHSTPGSGTVVRLELPAG